MGLETPAGSRIGSEHYSRITKRFGHRRSVLRTLLCWTAKPQGVTDKTAEQPAPTALRSFIEVNTAKRRTVIRCFFIHRSTPSEHVLKGRRGFLHYNETDGPQHFEALNAAQWAKLKSRRVNMPGWRNR